MMMGKNIGCNDANMYIYIYIYDANMYIYMHELANLLSECTFQNGKMYEYSSSSVYTVILASVYIKRYS